MCRMIEWLSHSLMKKLVISLTLALSLALTFYAGFYFAKHPLSTSLLVPQVVKEKARPLDKYTYENMAARNWQASEIKIESELSYKPTTVKRPYKFKQYLFSTTVDGKRVTGQINIPNIPTSQYPNVPIILMLRGYVPAENYQTGMGTRPTASVFAQNRFITVAPDFLGYGASDPRDPDEMTARFESYPIALTLLKSLQNPKFTCGQDLPKDACDLASRFLLITSRLFLFGHSNGGHLAIATLEIANHSPSFGGQIFPTVLWAPVSKPFPYSILAYEDEADDLGKNQRKYLARFEETYDVNLYSVHNYLDWINSPIELHQGTADEDVPYWWSREFVKTLKEKKKDIKYFEYPGTNHNMSPASETVISRSLAFFQSHLK